MQCSQLTVIDDINTDGQLDKLTAIDAAVC